MRRSCPFRRLIHLCLASLTCALIPLLSGCSLTTPTLPDGDTRPSSDVMEHAPADEIWRALAHSVEAGTIETTTRLAQFVAILARNGDLAENDVHEFDAAFPKITTESRFLGPSDVASLRGLASKHR